MLAFQAVRCYVESVWRSCDARNRLTTVDGVIDPYPMRITSKVFGDLSSARPCEGGQLLSESTSIMLGEGIPFQ